MTNSKNISILGAGWLGKPLAYQLQKNNHKVKVSTTTSEKINDFLVNDIEAILVNVAATSSNQALDQLLTNTDTLIITIPPGRHQQVENQNYVDRIKSIVPFIEKHQIKEVIFTSSTTVYISLKGDVDETSKIVPVSEMDRQIFAIENLLLDNKNFNASILRLGGLIGEDRHPVKYIVQREVIEQANNPVNMVHQTDIIRFVEKMVETKLPNEIFNIVAPISKNRRDFYTDEANRLGLSPLPKFIDSDEADQRRVVGKKIAQRYALDYLYLLD